MQRPVRFVKVVPHCAGAVVWAVLVMRPREEKAQDEDEAGAGPTTSEIPNAAVPLNATDAWHLGALEQVVFVFIRVPSA